MSEGPNWQRRVRQFMTDWRTEVGVGILIVVSVALVIVEAGLAESSPYYADVVFANQVITGIFIVELGLRFYGERKKKTFFRRYWYDIIAVIPLFRAARFLRILRLLRLFRVGMIAIRRLSQISRTFRYIRIEYLIIGLIAVTVVLMGGLSMRYAEPEVTSLGESLWFATMTLIAAEPIGAEATTPLGRVVLVTVMMGGLTVFAVLTGTVSAVMVETFRNMELRPMALEDLEEHVVVCGWNEAGSLIVEELLSDSRTFSKIVIVTETDVVDEQEVVQANPSSVFTVEGDFTRVDVLEEANVQRASHALILADSSIEDRSNQDRDARSVLAAMLIEKLNPDIYTSVQLLNRDNETSLRQIGVEEIIVSDEYVGNIMATVTKNRGIVTMLDELLTSKWGHQFYKADVPEELVGREVGSAMLALKEDYDATLLGVDTGDPDARHPIHVNPPEDFELESDHQIFVAGSEPIEEREIRRDE